MKSEKLSFDPELKAEGQFKIKKYLLKFWPIIFIFLVWFIFSSPYFLGNKAPFSATYQVNNFAPWSAYPKFWGPVKNGAMPDIITQIYPWKHFTIETFKNGQIPLWNPYSFSGTPHLANYQSAVLSPFNLLFFLLPFVDAWSLLVLLQPLLAGLFMYLFVRSLKRSQTASLISSISFMFCGFIVVWMDYATLAYAISFLPLALFCIEKYFESKQIRYLILLSFSIPLSFFSGHFQISIYFLITVLIYLIYKFITTKNINGSLKLTVFIFFGLLLSLPQLLPSIEFYLQSLRSTIFLKGEAIPWQYISTFPAPDFLGNPVTRNDWFGHYAEWNGYIGVLPLMLAIYSILSKKRVQTFFLLIMGVFALLIAFDTPLLTLLINFHIPVLSTSSASRIIVVYSFMFAAMSAFGLDQLVLDIREKKIKKIYFWITLFLIFFLVLWVIVFFKLFIPTERLIVARQNLILPSFIFLVSSLSILVFVFFQNTNKKVKYSFLALILIIIVAFDMFRFAKKWQPFDPKNLVFPSTPTTQEFLRLKGYERVFGNLCGEALVYYGMPSIEGYDALYIKRYGEFIAFLNSGIITQSPRSVVQFSRNGKYASESINLLGIKYIIHKKADDQKTWTFPYWTYPKDRFIFIYEDERYRIFENKDSYPRAFVVGKYKVIDESNKIIETMFNNNFDLKKEIVLEKNPSTNQTKDIRGDIKIIKYSPNLIEMEVATDKNAILFLSDNYYTGWNATVDNKKSEILRADYTIRAVPVPAGKHTVRFVYDPQSFKLGVYAALLGIILIALSALKFRRNF